MSRPWASDSRATRRRFLRRLAAAAVPLAVGGCRKPSPARAVAEPVAPAPAQPDAPPDRPPLPDREPVIRVRIRRLRDRGAAVTLGPDDSWVELRAPDRPSAGGGGESLGLLRTPVRIAWRGGRWSVTGDAGFRPAVQPEETLAVLGTGPGPLVVENRPYPGELRLVARDGGFDVVNHVRLESYLPGVLTGELFRHWHLQTFAAQAIAARSFACSEHAFFGSRRHYDVTDTPRSQVYDGAVSTERARRAVAMTGGAVLAFAGSLVPGYYSSCCGGAAATAPDAIGPSPYNDVPPLRGRSSVDVCTDAPLYTWSIRRSRSDVIRRLRAYGRERKIDDLATLDGLTTVAVTEVNAHGRPRRFAVVGRNGDAATLGAETLRRALDFPDRDLEPPAEPLWSSNLFATVAGDTIRLDGHGHGHGVGLCQYGAQAMARTGAPHDAILAWYYPAIEIIRRY